MMGRGHDMRTSGKDAYMWERHMQRLRPLHRSAVKKDLEGPCDIALGRHEYGPALQMIMMIGTCSHHISTSCSQKYAPGAQLWCPGLVVQHAIRVVRSPAAARIRTWQGRMKQEMQCVQLDSEVHLEEQKKLEGFSSSCILPVAVFASLCRRAKLSSSSESGGRLRYTTTREASLHLRTTG
jgi:hypothetical protein